MEINEQGVVNPLRWPRPVRDLAGQVARLPLVGKLFLVLAVADLVIGQVGHGLDVGSIVSALTLLLPVAAVWRATAPGSVDRRILVGTIVIAAIEVARLAFRWLDPVFAPAEPTEEALAAMDVPLAVRGVLSLAGTAAGWALVARGLAALRPASPGVSRSIGSIVAGLAIATGAGYVALDLVVISRSGSPAIAPTQLALELAWGASWIVTAGLAWVAITRAGRWPDLATRCAAIAASLWAVGSIPALLIAFAVVQGGGDGSVELQSIGIWIAQLTTLATLWLFAAALAAGLADTATAERVAPAA